MEKKTTTKIAATRDNRNPTDRWRFRQATIIAPGSNPVHGSSESGKRSA